jgi:hypothetical protein
VANAAALRLGVNTRRLLIALGDDAPPSVEGWFRQAVLATKGAHAQATAPPLPKCAPPESLFAAIAFSPPCHD